MPKAKKVAKKSDGLILYQGNGEVLVTTPAHEKKMLKEWFCEGERDPSDYDGKINTSQMIRLLVKHAKDPVPWTATAPWVESGGSVPGGWAAMTATAGGPGVFLETDTGVALSCIPWREDWTIHRKAYLAPKKELFALGETIQTMGAEKAFSAETRSKCLQRHARGDWGDVNNISKRTNDRAVKSGGRLFSVYRNNLGLKSDDELWIITEADRSVTTLLLPEEY